MRATSSPTQPASKGSRSRRGGNGHTGGKAAAAALTAAGNGGVRALDTTQRPTVVYIHGIQNKPPVAVLKLQWDRALFGMDMGDRTRMAYWADIRYPTPLTASLAQPVPPTVMGAHRVLSDEELLAEGRAQLPPEAGDYASRMARELLPAARETEDSLLRVATGTAPADGDGAARMGAAEIGAAVLPNPLRGWLAEPIMKSLVPDTAAYFFNAAQREAIRNRLRSILLPGGGPYIVVAHSMGTVIAYDVLRELDGANVEVPLLVTLGSPLGLSEVEDHIVKPLRVPARVQQWRNFAARMDVVALDPTISDEFQPKGSIVDTQVDNPETVHLDPHSITGYLSLETVRGAIRGVAGPGFISPISHFQLAKDLVADMGGDSVRRLPVLIELGDEAAGLSLDEKRQSVAKALKEITGGAPESGIDPLRRYVAAELTAAEVEQVRVRHPELRFERVWRNTSKRALLDVSVRTAQANVAQAGYGAMGDDIQWAILDTGIQADHPHFKQHHNIKSIWDCTRPGRPVAAKGVDRNGHGTHVAGIIAGEGKDTQGKDTQGKDAGGKDGPVPEYRGMAPHAGLHVYKVLDDLGDGQDSWIIKALDHIADRNDASPTMAIHGINLSLGGSFDPAVYQCGFSPICRELRRLWRQGVVVCIACGNEGRLTVLTADGTDDLNVDLSVGDPANLAEAIAVGSVHKQSPHLYGISYFSSRGPTADGRAKPDLVAPGEQIVSCNARFHEPGQSPYVSLSGTSMACPHVSGMIAGFLSVRREFIGYPDRVKEILLANCTDLERDRYHQGAGLPNLIKMLANT